MFEIIFLVVLAAFAIGGIWAYVVSKKVKEEGIETDAVVSRIELHEWGGGAEEPWTPSITEDYYITYTNQEGKTVEAMLSNPGEVRGLPLEQTLKSGCMAGFFAFSRN